VETPPLSVGKIMVHLPISYESDCDNTKMNSGNSEISSAETDGTISLDV
jgi:hypothetical protein